MTHLEIRCGCGGKVVVGPIADVPPPPGALLEVTTTPPDEWRGWVWRCAVCGSEVGVTFDYGELDLGIVRDSDLRDPGFEVFP